MRTALGAGAAILTGLPVLTLGMGAVVASATNTTALTMGAAVPTQYTALILAAAETCPRITPAILAAQLDTESGFNPNATSPAGAQGIAQFTPQTWAQWGGDYNRDGTNSPYDPADAIPAQAAYMCHLIEQITGTGLATTETETIELALAAYNAGLNAVTEHAGIPPYPETQAYVTQVTVHAADPAYAVILNPRWDAANIDTALPPGYHNTRTAEEAIQYGLSQIGVYRDAGYCLRFVAGAYGPPNTGHNIQHAHEVWDNSPTQLHHPHDLNPPRGAIILWNSTIGNGAGHIAISLGDGTMITTTRGAITIQHIAGFSDNAYLGWMPPYFTRG